MRVAIVGAGAIGSAYGAMLAAADVPVTLVDVRRDHVEAIRADGLVAEGVAAEGTTVTLPDASTDPAAVAGADVVVVLTKAYATAEVARAIARSLGAEAIVVTLQNGLGNDAALAAVVGAERVVAGATTVGAELLGPGRVRLVPSTAAGRSQTALHLPPVGDPRRAAVERFAAVLEDARLPADAREDGGAVVWRKLALTASIGPLCAALRCTVAEALDEPDAVDAARQVFDEVVAVGSRDGVALDGPALWAHARETWAGIGPHRPSIAVDVAEGRRTEIDALCGEVVRRGAALGVPTPATELVHAVVAALDPDEAVSAA